MTKRNFKIFIMVLIMSCLLLAPACSKSKQAKVVRINASPSYMSAQIHLIRELNLLEKHLPSGVTVEWSGITSAPDIRDALVSDKLDIGDLGSINLISSIENGLPLVLVSNSGVGLVNIYSKRGDIESLSDFSASDQIAITNRGTNLHAAFLAQCKEDFGDAMQLDTALVPIPGSDAIVSVQNSDDFDGAIFSFPNLIKVQDIENVKLVCDMTEAIKKYGVGTLIAAREDFFDNNPQLIEALLKAQQDAVDYVANEPEKAADILGEFFGVESKHVLELLRTLPPTTAIRGYDIQAEMFYEAGILQNKPKPLNELKNYENLEIAE